MPLTLYNTMSRRKEELRPIDPRNVRMYVCGPTVYDFAHIGNARPVVVFDVLFRLLRREYGEAHVTYVRNITDVEDKINAAAKERGETIRDLTERTAKAFREDMAALGALPPTHEPRATEHIPQMIAMIATLIARGHAYEAEGHVLFQIATMKEYGRLSRRTLDEMIDGARVEVAPYKRDPGDFVLWKPSPPDLPGWESPWGRGRPGWHIECSAMSESLLGEHFDIHGGGLDLIFPHHENEIAQSLCAHEGRPFVDIWMHNGFLTVSGEKMSKSLGNFVTVHELLREWPGEVIRLALLSGHYREPLDFSAERLEQAKQMLDRFYRAIGEAAKTGTRLRHDDHEPAAVIAALTDDLNTPLALAGMHEALHALNASLQRAPEEAAEKAAMLRAGGALLGLLQQDPARWLKGEADDAAAIEDAIRRRNAARKAKDFALADRIRAELAGQGIVLEDKPGGKTEWRRA
ncbi:MAG TPA: cysteine--tRNA ligase [Stellaceae bacterium]|nr:cysteine--tRNA ligase [Stellaceae bacterium]